jgi:hypothetical protein
MEPEAGPPRSTTALTVAKSSLMSNALVLAILAALAFPANATAGGGRPDLRVTYAVDAPSPFPAGAKFSTAARV